MEARALTHSIALVLCLRATVHAQLATTPDRRPDRPIGVLRASAPAREPRERIGEAGSIRSVGRDADVIQTLLADRRAGGAAWMVEGDQEGAYGGYCVASAGDVNGDGFSDVIVGTIYYDNAETNEGRASVYLGSASGLSNTPAWTVYGGQAGAFFGASLASAGDVNDDGYDDVIVGAYSYDNGQSNEGQVYVYLGSASGLSTTPVWTAEGNQASANFGYSVASAGDVNGDGYDDVIVGAYRYDNGQTDEGRAFVYLGSATGLSAGPAWMAEGNQANAHFARCVASAGDVNGDGFADVIVGAPLMDNGQLDEGRAFVYLGSASGLAESPAWTAEGDQTGAAFGRSAAGAGDVNQDGYGDVIVGAYNYDNSLANEGRAFAYLGSPSGLSAAAACTMDGGQAGAIFGYSVAGAGDVNGDGYDDVIVGAYLLANGETDEGQASMYLGSASGLIPGPAWRAEIDQASAAFGFCVASAGDVNGDMLSDVIIGATNYDNGAMDEGAAFVYLGSAVICPPGDMNCDCALDPADVAAFVEALIDPMGYATNHPLCDPLRGDMQPDGVLDGADLQRFVDLLIP